MTNSLQARIDALSEDKELQANSEKQLITIESTHALAIFTEQSRLNEVLTSIKMKIKSIVPDVYSEKGRKEIASMAYSVARTKTYLDSIGKDLVDQYKELPKKIDSGRKFARDALDSLRDEVREPLTLWEKEQEALRLREKISLDHGIALEMHADWLNRRAEQLELEELRRKEKERLIKEQAEREAVERAEKEIQRMKLQHERAMVEQQRKLAAAELEAKRAEERKVEAIEAEKRRSAEQARIILEKQKRDKEYREEQERLEEEHRQKLLNDQAHIKKIHDEIIEDLMEMGYEKCSSEAILLAIVNKKIRHLSINY
jgi:colicin import membrane protein